jgi:mannitol-1-phosphate 5-dehydrogenase
MGVAEMSKITIVGAGKTGRGFLARLLNGNEITFIDKDQALVQKLNEAKKFDVKFFGNKKPTVTVQGYVAKTWADVSSIQADVIFVSVGGTNLADVGKELKKYVTCGQRIIVCENASSPAKKLFEAIGVEGVKIAESTVFCTTIEGGELDINSEWYPYLQFDAEALKGNLPELDGIKPVENFGGFLDRKLYTYNSASCVIAYLGYLKGYTVYSDAANDPEILALLDKNYEIINECICKEYGYGEEDQKEFALLSRDKFTDTTLVDTVARNAREPQRKITKTERIVAPMLLEIKYGKDSSVLEKTLAAMLLYTPKEEEKWIQILEEKGYEGVLTELAGLDKESEVYARVLALAKSGKIL